MKRKVIGWDCLWKPVKRGRLFGELVHDNVIYIRRQEEDVSRFQVCLAVRPANSNGRGCAQHTGMNHLAFIVQIFQPLQNVIRQTQDKFEGKPRVGELAL